MSTSQSGDVMKLYENCYNTDMGPVGRQDSETKPPNKKPVRWMGSSRKDLSAMPEDIQDAFGKALLQAQFGGRAANAETLHGFGGASVIEIKEDEGGSTYRLIYTVRYPRYVYALHAFKKKSHHESQTPKQDRELIQTRLSAAEADHAQAPAVEQEPQTPAPAPHPVRRKRR